MSKLNEVYINFDREALQDPEVNQAFIKLVTLITHPLVEVKDMELKDNPTQTDSPPAQAKKVLKALREVFHKTRWTDKVYLDAKLLAEAIALIEEQLPNSSK